MIKVIGVKWINAAAKEAEVTISNGHSEIVCFSQPFNLSESDELVQPLFCLNVHNILKSNSDCFAVEKQGESFGFFLRGRIINLNEKIVDVEGYLISLDEADFPGDLIEGDFIEFMVSRLDIY
ncbi:MAG: hypothetical protein K9L62_12380 [Vallitaleaceae bacterium]|nr:hypothetical protein [Vallitaleaceae bacterium]